MRGEFDFAVDWCKRNYPELFGSHIISIDFVKGKDFTQHAQGLCYFLPEGKSKISIRQQRVHVSKVINTIIHEATHSKQWLDGKKWKVIEIEDEAYKAGNDAEYKYLESVRPK